MAPIDTEPDRAGELNRRLVRSGVEVSELRREEKSLEEVFLAMTGDVQDGR